MNKRLDILRRKQIGKLKVHDYKKVFIKLGPEHFDLIDLEKSDIILNEARKIFSDSVKQSEIISGSAFSFVESDLLRDIYLGLGDESFSYIFTDDFEFCGIFLVKAKKAIENVFDVANRDAGHTCFVLDSNFDYYIRVNYYDPNDNDNPYSYDIEKSVGKMHTLV